MRRRLSSGASLLAWVLALATPQARLASSAEVAAKRPARVLPGSPAELKTKDGWTLSAQYSPAKDSQPTFILLHDFGGRKENWYYLAKAMARRGIGVMALDMRGHGGSQNPPPGREGHWRKFRVEKDDNEWNNMASDVEAAVDYLKSQGVAEDRVALGGADVGSSIALRYAAVHKQVPMTFLLSPGFSYREVLTVNAMRMYGKRPILMAVGLDDKRCLAEMPVLFQIALNAAGPDNARRLDVEREHGTRMLPANKGMIEQLTDWMEHPQVPAQVVSSTSAAVTSPQVSPNGEAASSATAPSAPASEEAPAPEPPASQ